MFRSFLSLMLLASLMAVQSHAAAQTKSGPRNTAKPAVTTTVNINTATAAEFDALPGVGAKTAALIIEYRQKNGPFKKVEDILETSRSCPSSLSVSCLSAHQSVSRTR